MIEIESFAARLRAVFYQAPCDAEVVMIGGAYLQFQYLSPFFYHFRAAFVSIVHRRLDTFFSQLLG